MSLLYETLSLGYPCCRVDTTELEQLVTDYWCQVNTCVMTNITTGWTYEIYGKDSECAYNAVNNYHYLLDLLIYIRWYWTVNPTLTLEEIITEFDIDCIKKTFMCCGCNITNALAVFGLARNITAPTCPNPEPYITNRYDDDDCICSGTAFVYVPVISMSGVYVTWDRAVVSGISNPAASGVGSINETLINTTTSPVTVTYIITMVKDEVTTTEEIEVIICPAITVDAGRDQTICLGEEVTLTATGGGTGATYTWDHGVENGVSFTPTETLTYTVTSINDNGCTDTDQVTITIADPPTVDPMDDIIVCPGNEVNVPAFTGNPQGVTFTWTNNNTDIGLAASGSGDITPYEAPANTTGEYIVGTITVTPHYGDCDGEPITFTISINYTPDLTSSLDPIPMTCGGTMNYTPTSSDPLAYFVWTREEVACCTNPAGSGFNLINETLYCAPRENCNLEYKIIVCHSDPDGKNLCCSEEYTLPVTLWQV